MERTLLMLGLSIWSLFFTTIETTSHRFTRGETKERVKDKQVLDSNQLSELKEKRNSSLMMSGGSVVNPDFLLTESYGSSVSSVTVNIPPGSSIGDMVMVYIVTDDDGNLTEPAEFTEIFNLARDGNGPQSGLFYRIIDGTEATSYVFSIPYSEPAVVTTLRYKNIDTSNPFDVTASLTGDSNNPQAPSVTTTKNGRTVLQFIGIDGSSASVLTSNSATGTIVAAAESGTGGGNAEMMIVAEFQEFAGATPVGSFSFTTDEWTGMSVALNAYNISNNAVTGTACPAGTATYMVDYDLPTASGTLELVDPLGAVVASQAYSTATGTLTFSFTPTFSGSYIVQDQAITSISTSQIFLIDTDGDTYCDDVDADDDNDGILDIRESPSCFNTATGYESGDRTALITVSTSMSYNDGDPQQLVDGDQSTTGNGIRKTNGNYSFASNPGNLWQFQLSSPIKYTSFSLYTEGTIYLDSDIYGTIQGSNDGSTWTDLTVANGLLMDDPNTVYSITLTQNQGTYTYYRMWCTGGQVDDDEWLSEITGTTELTTPAPYTGGLCDSDGSIPNHLDTDSDDNGCPDALEGDQVIASTNVDANGRLTGGVDGNGVPLIVNGGQGVGDSQNANYFNSDCPCTDPTNTANNCDFDGDLVLNEVDKDKDNDGIWDDSECGDFGFLNAPGGSSNNTVTVCYTTGTNNSINGSQLTFADDKMLNPANFGPSGTYKVNFNLIPFAPDDLTEANLTAQGCQIYHVGGDSGFSGTEETSLTATQKQELYNWSTLSPRNVVFAFQGMITSWSDHVGMNGTTNPTSGTMTGRAIFEGPFGTVNSFNQAGGYQGIYTLGSDPACVIMEDANGGVVGLVDEISQDIFVADFGLFGEAGGMTSNTGISSSVDMMYANIYAFMAQFILEGQTDMCYYLNECTGNFDGDAFANVYDLDTDGDGCTDALEGDSTIAETSVDVNGHLIGGVDAAGVPTIIGNGQGLGDSQNSGVIGLDCPCMDPDKYATNCDFDGDQIKNAIDLDDDNDGIVDTNEDTCGSNAEILGSFSGDTSPSSNGHEPAAPSDPLFTTDPRGAAGAFTTGTPGAGNDWCSHLHKLRVNTTQLQVVMDKLGAHQNMTFSLLHDPTGTATTFGELTYMDFGSTCQLSSGSSGSVGSGENMPGHIDCGSTTSSQDLLATFSGLTCGDIYYLAVYRISDGDRYTLSFNGTAQCNTVCDEDNDLIPNSFDLDSDGDNCADVLEGTGIFTGAQIANDTLTGGVDAMGVPLIAGATGHLVGQSQDASLSVACSIDLKVTTNKSTDGASKGEFIEYTFTVTNESNISASEVEARVLIPSNTEFIAAIPSQGSYSNLTKIWDIGTVDPGSHSIVITLKVK